MASVGQGPRLEEGSDGEGALRIDTSVFEALSGTDAGDPVIVRWFDCWRS